MNTAAMRSFLSDCNIRQHVEHLRHLKLLHSVNEKSFPEIKGMPPAEISRAPLPKREKWEILGNLKSIKAHELYFSSFTERPAAVKALRRYFSSEEAFLYEALELGKGGGCSFLYVYVDGRGRPALSVSRPGDDFFIRREPLLAVDLFEHAYFSDYGFDSEKYLKSALSHLDLARLGKYLSD